jgi:hypothetical protein
MLDGLAHITPNRPPERVYVCCTPRVYALRNAVTTGENESEP